MKTSPLVGCITGVVIFCVTHTSPGIFVRATDLQPTVWDDSTIGNGWQPSADPNNHGFHKSHDFFEDYPINHEVSKKYGMDHVVNGGSEMRSTQNRVRRLPSILGSFKIRGRATTYFKETKKNNDSSDFRAVVDYDFLMPPPQIALQKTSRPLGRINEDITDHGEQTAYNPKPHLIVVHSPFSVGKELKYMPPEIYSRNHLQTRTNDNSGVGSNVSQDSASSRFHDHSHSKLSLELQHNQIDIFTTKRTNLYDRPNRKESPESDVNTIITKLQPGMNNSRISNGYISNPSQKSNTNMVVDLLSLKQKEHIPGVTTSSKILKASSNQLSSASFHNGTQNEISPQPRLINRDFTENTVRGHDTSNMTSTSNMLGSLSNRNMSVLSPNELHNNDSHPLAQKSISQSALHKILPYSEFRSETPESLSLRYFNNEQKAFRKQLIEHDRQYFLSKKSSDHIDKKISYTNTRMTHNSGDMTPQRNHDSPTVTTFKMNESKIRAKFKSDLMTGNRTIDIEDDGCAHPDVPDPLMTVITTLHENDNVNDITQLIPSQKIDITGLLFQPNQSQWEHIALQNSTTATVRNLSMKMNVIPSTPVENISMPVIPTKLGANLTAISDHRNSSSYSERINPVLLPYQLQTVHRMQPYTPTRKCMYANQNQQSADQASTDRSFTDAKIGRQKNEQIHDAVHMKFERLPCEPHEFIQSQNSNDTDTPESTQFRAALTESIYIERGKDMKIDNETLDNRTRTDSLRWTTGKHAYNVSITPLENLFNFTTEGTYEKAGSVQPPIYTDKIHALGNYVKFENGTTAMRISVTNQPEATTLKKYIRPRFSIKHFRNQLEYKNRLSHSPVSSNSSHPMATLHIDKSLSLLNAIPSSSANTSHNKIETKSQFDNNKLLTAPIVSKTSNYSNDTMKTKVFNVLQHNRRAHNNRRQSNTSINTDTHRKNRPFITSKIERRLSPNGRRQPYSAVFYRKSSGKSDGRTVSAKLNGNSRILSNSEKSDLPGMSSSIPRNESIVKSSTKLYSRKNVSNETPWRQGQEINRLKQTMNDSIDVIPHERRNPSNLSNHVLNRTALHQNSYNNPVIFSMQDSGRITKVKYDRHTDARVSNASTTNFATTHNHTGLFKSVAGHAFARKNKMDHHINGVPEQPALPIEEFFRELSSR